MLHDDILTFRVVGSDQATATVMKGLKLDLSQCVTFAIYHSRSRGLLLWLEAFPGEKCWQMIIPTIGCAKANFELEITGVNIAHSKSWD